MRGALLFWRSRHISGALAALTSCNLIGLAFVNARIERAGSEAGIPWVLFLPLLSASLIGLSLASSTVDLDRAAFRRLHWYRLAQILTLGVPAIILVAAVGSQLSDSPSGAYSAARNLFGLTGLALISGRLLGERLSWMPPMLWCMASAALGDPRSTLPAWDWLVRPDENYQASLIAWLLGCLGLVLGCLGPTYTRLRTTASGG